MSKGRTVQAVAELESVIHELRGHRVMLDSDLARAYGVETRALVQAVKRNPDRFPDDFAFQLTNQEVARLRSQSVIFKVGGRNPGGRRFGIPWAFTEHGAVMAANLLRSPAAIDMSIHVARAFVRTRRTLAARAELADDLRKLKRGLAAKFGQYDEQFRVVFLAIEQLISPPEPNRPKIGFRPDND